MDEVIVPRGHHPHQGPVHANGNRTAAAQDCARGAPDPAQPPCSVTVGARREGTLKLAHGGAVPRALNSPALTLAAPTPTGLPRVPGYEHADDCREPLGIDGLRERDLKPDCIAVCDPRRLPGRWTAAAGTSPPCSGVSVLLSGCSCSRPRLASRCPRAPLRLELLERLEPRPAESAAPYLCAERAQHVLRRPRVLVVLDDQDAHSVMSPRRLRLDGLAFRASTAPAGKLPGGRALASGALGVDLSP